MTDARSQAQNRRPKATWLGFLRDETAASAVFFALTIASTVGIVGLGAETGLWFAEKRQYQTAADAGAIAGALSLVAQKNADNDVTLTLNTSETGPAWTEAVRNGASTFVLNKSVWQGDSANGTGTLVHVEVSELKNTMLAAVSSLASVTIKTVAEATVEDLGQPCINGLSGDDTAIQIQASTIIHAPNCVITSNSKLKGDGTANSGPNQASVTVQGGAGLILDVAQIYSLGSIVSGGNPNLGAPLSGMGSAEGTANPFESVPVPTVGTAPTSNSCSPQVAISAAGGPISPGTLCKFGQNGNNGTSSTQSGPVTLVGHAWTLSGAGTPSNVIGNLTIGQGNTVSSLTITGPGDIYINGDLSIASGGTLSVTGANVYVYGNVSVSGHLTVNNGTITIRNGYFKTSGGSFSGTGTTVALSGTSGYFNIDPSSTVNVTAPDQTSSSAYKGIAFYQDPASTSTSNIGGGNSTIVGAIYAKNATVKFGGNSGSTCTVIVAKVIQFSGNSSLETSGCATYGISLPHFYKVSLSL